MRGLGVIWVLLLGVWAGGCGLMKGAVRTRLPELSVEGVQVAGLSFRDIDLVFDLGVDNPNPLPVTLAGFDYELLVEGNSLLKGRQEESTYIAATGLSVVQLPLRLMFGDLRRVLAALADQDSAGYELACELTFDLPVLGERRLPLRHRGQVPVVRPPQVEMEGLRLARLNLTGADLELQLRVANPNGFSLALDRLQYAFAVEGVPWASGTAEWSVRVAERGAQTVVIPVALDFVRMGTTAYRALARKEPLDYQLTGQLEMGTSLPLLPRTALPLELAGRVGVRR